MLLSAFASPPSESSPSTTAANVGNAPEKAPPPQDQDADEAQETEAGSDELIVPSRVKAPPIASAVSLPRSKDILARAKRDGSGHLVVAGKGGDDVLTINPALQEKLTRTLESYGTPYGAVVVLEPSTGRVLAMAEHSKANPAMRGLTTKAIFPAASVFKIVTASALLNEGVTPDATACFHGGKRNISAKMLEDSRKDSRCMSLTNALARSANGIFAKLTHRYLTAQKLKGFAAAYHFNEPMDFPIPTDTSLAAVPDDALGLAATGAGFGDVFMSPLHGALIASVAANGGLWRKPVLFERDVLTEGEPERVISEGDAAKLAHMMGETVRVGTARRAFSQRGFALKDAAGKTGSLADKSPFRDYSWFVGYAPREHPKVAVAAIIVNDYKWRIRAPWLAREAMRLYLEDLNQRAISAR